MRSLVSPISTLELPVSGNPTGVVFFKTHKTGGSTLTSVLWRQLCVVEKRNCFRPAADHPGKTYDLNKESDSYQILKTIGTAGRGPPFDAWLNHAYYHPSLTNSIVIQPNIALSIVREPAERFRSAWDWYNLSYLLGEADMNLYINELYDLNAANRRLVMQKHSKKAKFHSYLNSYSAELTHTKPLSLEFQAVFLKLLTKVQSGDIFLLVCDRYLESLLLLRRLMGWSSMASILHIPMKENKDHKGVDIEGETHRQLLELQPWDWRLFIEANATLDKYIQVYGKTDFDSDLHVFKEAMNNVYVHCVEKQSSDTFTFNGTSISCEELGRDNRDHVQALNAAVVVRDVP